MVGKTSLFTILTGVHESTRVGHTEAQVGMTKVPDKRLDALTKLFEPKKVTYAVVEYLDYPSISKEVLRNPSYLAGLRVADSLAHVVRLFASDTVPHEKGSVDPARDISDVETELALSDLVVVEKRLERLEKERKKIKSLELEHETELLERCKTKLESGEPLRDIDLMPEEEKLVRGFQFLSQKPMLYVLNIGEEDAGRLHEIEQEYLGGLLKGRKHVAVTGICGNVEAELSAMSAEDAGELLASYGLKESGLERLIAATYRLLGLMSFLTAGEDEVRAWTIPIHCPAVKAAGAIHSDFEKKFIRAEVVNWQTLIDYNGFQALKEKGLLRLEGKEYIVKDGDVLVIRHS